MKSYTDEERKNHVAAWKAGGLSRSAYARGQGLPVTTFCKWANEEEAKGQGFVELTTTAGFQEKQEIIIEKKDVRIRLPVEMLERVLGTVLGISGRPV
jgi:transposase-like protein